MTQTYEKFMVYTTPKAKEVEVQIPEETIVDELLGDLNPRYFEETYTLQEAKTRDYTKQYDVFFY
ncbi:MAG: hypothetical protein ACW986_16620 [Promethearchaeota archaeon]|jgi:hypothetical protein